MKSLFKIFSITLIILLSYYCFLSFFSYKAIYGETSLNSGLLRLQSLLHSKHSSSILVGTSLSAKLKPNLIFNEFDSSPINLGIDGGAPVFGAKKILEYNHVPKIILVETNYLGKRINSNMNTLNEELESFRFKSAKYLPVLRQEYRPVTLLYSTIKSVKDDLMVKHNIDSEISAYVPLNVIYLSIFDDSDFSNVPIEREWGNIIYSLKSKGSKIVFLMVPDGNHDRKASYEFTKFMAAKYNIPFIDLKSELKSYKLHYSDGLHLIKSSAIEVSEALNTTLKEVNFFQ